MNGIRRLNARLGIVSAFGVYIVAALVLFCSSSLLSGTAYLGCANDPSLYIWIFQFLPQSIEHLRNILVLKTAWAPIGLNITEATTTPLLAILAWPITALFGPIVAFNIVSMAAPACAATSCFAFASTYTKSWSTALVAGWIFGFSTAVFAPMSGHLQTDFIAFVPLAFLFVSERAAGNITKARFLFWLSFVLIAQFLVSIEIFVTEALFLFLFVLVIEAGRFDGMIRLVHLLSDNLFLGLITAYSAVGLILSPLIYNFFCSYSKIPHILQDGGKLPLDLTNFVVPTPVTWLGGMSAMPLTQLYAGNYSEDLGYIGAPLVLITMIGSWRLRHDRRAWPLFAVLGCGFILTLGPQLHILGRPYIELPWTLIEKLPLLRNALPGRLMVFVLLGISGICALWVGNLPRHRWIALAAIVSAEIFVLPATFTYPAIWNTPVPTAQLFADGSYRSLIRQGDTVLFLPFTFTDGNVMFWQVETRGYFRMVNGYGNFVPEWFNRWPAVQMIEANLPSQNFSHQFDLFVRAAHIDEVIVPISILTVWSSVLEQGGWHPQVVGDLAVFKEPSCAPKGKIF